MSNDNNEEGDIRSAFKKFDQSAYLNSLNKPYSYESELIDLLNAQHRFIGKLLEGQAILCNQLARGGESTEPGQSNMSFHQKRVKVTDTKIYNCSGSDSGNFGQEMKKPKNNIIQIEPHLTTIQKLQRRTIFKYEIDSSESSQEIANVSPSEQKEIPEVKVKNQTKNIIKNFAKSILSYIAKNKPRRDRVLKHLGILQSDFLRVLHEFKGKIYSISELRNLWMQNGNRFSRAFRIMSSQYLRRHSLQHIFNSRIENHLIHIKYRQRLIQSLDHPQQFTVLKIK